MNGYNFYDEIVDPSLAEVRPFDFNAGFIAAVAAHDSAVLIAGQDTLQETSGNQNKLFAVTPQLVLGSTGSLDDVNLLAETLGTHMEIFKFLYGKIMPTEIIFHALTIIMTQINCTNFLSNILVGLDSYGNGVVYVLDTNGHSEITSINIGGKPLYYIPPILCKVMEGDIVEKVEITSNGIQSETFYITE